MRPNMRSFLQPAIALSLLVAPVAFTPSFAQSASGTPATAATPGSAMPAPGTKTVHKVHKTHKAAYHHRLHHKPTGAVPSTTTP
jgi:hypothetical protein